MSMEGTGVSANRERMVKNFLKTDATHLLFIDDDMGFNPDALHVLASRRQPIVACNYRVRTPPAPFMAKRDGKEIKITAESTGLEEVDFVPFGLCLMERRVLESIPVPRFMIEYIERDFNDYTTEDVSFCNKVRTQYPIYIDHDASKKVWHAGNIHYTWADDFTNMNKVLKAKF
jgi:hypothetical protein